ncbi:hypothetical protein [Streptomyces atroolivaceus]|uniref:hypothetical protein n=1 Tax=Streptomyces atroolivaceus TaxID=66869 RepID=UPI0036AB8502
MSNQYPQHPPFVGGPGYPPPRKPMSVGAIIAIVTGSVFGGVLVLLLILLVVGDDAIQADKSPSLEVTAPVVTKSATAAPAKPTEKTSEEPQQAAKKPQPKEAEYPSGDYVVSEDIPVGTYTSSGAEAGIFEFCSITTEPTGETTMPKIKSAGVDERIIITLTEADGVVSISGCEPLKPRK